MSNETKWTPGPWQSGWGDGITGGRVGPTAYLDDCDAIQHPIRAGDRGVAWILSMGDDGRVAADARLIAAAPELYDALAQFAEAWDAPARKNLADLFDAYKAARSALAKARGETP